MFSIFTTLNFSVNVQSGKENWIQLNNEFSNQDACIDLTILPLKNPCDFNLNMYLFLIIRIRTKFKIQGNTFFCKNK